MNSQIAYTRAFEAAFDKLSALPQTKEPVVGDALNELCELLGIGLLRVDFYADPEAEKKGIAKSAVFFTREDVDFSRSVIKRLETGGRNIVHYTVCPRSGSTDWGDSEKESVERLLRMLYVFNGRNVLMNLADRLTNYDVDLEIHNLHYFLNHCGMLIARRQIGSFIALYFNLKRFTTINQQIGRKGGTLVMKRFAEHLSGMLSEGEVLSRIGGDNFCLIVRKENGRRFIKELEGSAIVYDDDTGERVMVSATVGIYVIPEKNNLKSPTEIMDRISAAVQIARNSADTDIVYFDELFMRQREKELNIEAAFPAAFKNEEFLVYYQPKISLDDYTLCGAEALCRWLHNGSLVSPAEFIPLLERGMEICKLDFYMLEHVCRDIRRWLDEGKRVVRVSVNFSRRHLTDMDFLTHVLEIIDRYRVPHEYIEVELTETTTDVLFRDLKRVVKGLQKEGISTAVDDFGVGYSSLNLIRDIPWNVLKIDKSFLPSENEGRTEEKELMFHYVVAMAQSLKLECIVEGVETKEQIELLRQNSCMLAQGFFFDKPLPVESFEKKLDNYVYEVVTA